MLILTGSRGCGKTTLLQRIILDDNLAVQGFLSLKIVKDGVPVGIKLLTLPEGEEIFMATATPKRTELSTGHYAFETGTFQLIEKRFALLNNSLPFILDEFGLLEMRGLGHYPLFQRLAAVRLKMLVVVRRDLLAEFMIRYTIAADTVVLDVEQGDKDIKKRVCEYLSTKTELPQSQSESYRI
jgi:nucleoside-triphosphatase THEP1